MEKNAKGLLPKIEVIIVAVFALSFLVWIIPKCGSDRLDPEENPEELLLADSTEEVSTAGGTAGSAPAKPDSSAQKTLAPPTAAAVKPEQQYSRLYVTIEGLNLRLEPGLNSKVLAKLALFEEVFFLNEVTDSTTEVSLGYETANEPWVKIRTRKGQEGWVYGAGVNYYKKKRSGTLE